MGSEVSAPGNYERLKYVRVRSVHQLPQTLLAHHPHSAQAFECSFQIFQVDVKNNFDV